MALEPLKVENVNKIVAYGNEIGLVEAFNSRLIDAIVYAVIKPDGELLIPGEVYDVKARLMSGDFGLPRPPMLIDIEDFQSVPIEPLSEVYKQLRSVAEDLIDFHDSNLYDIVTAYTMYTWVRGLFPKNINMYILGFPGTGKSQVASFIKAFGRYVIDYDPGSERSVKWFMSMARGVLLIDEAEYLTKSKLSVLRKYHEKVVESKMLAVPGKGLTQFVMYVDAPIVVSATHVPSDVAFLQRGYIIRMRKGKPKVKSINDIEGVDELKLVVAKSVLSNWKHILDNTQFVKSELANVDVDERVKDIAIPVMAMLRACGIDYDWVLTYAKKSFVDAFLATPENIMMVKLLRFIVEVGDLDGEFYVIDQDKVMGFVDKVLNETVMTKSRVKYIVQYLYSGCETSIEDGKLVFGCHKPTVDSILKMLNEKL